MGFGFGLGYLLRVRSRLVGQPLRRRPRLRARLKVRGVDALEQQVDLVRVRVRVRARVRVGTAGRPG